MSNESPESESPFAKEYSDEGFWRKVRAAGKSARQIALKYFGLDRFLREWDELIEEVSA